MTTATMKERIEHVEVTEARAALASIRFELETIEREIAGIDRGDIVELHPRVKKKRALDEERASAERALREVWTQYEASAIIADGYPALLRAIDDYIASVEAMQRARACTVAARALFNGTWQESHKGVPRESLWSLNDAPPAIPIPELSERDFGDWASRVRQEYKSWARSWAPA